MICHGHRVCALAGFLLPCSLRPIIDEMLYSLIVFAVKDFLFAYLQNTESLVAQCTVGDEGILRWWSNVGQSMWVASVHENSRSKSVTPSSCTIVLILLCQVKWLEELTGASVTSSSSSLEYPTAGDLGFNAIRSSRQSDCG